MNKLRWYDIEYITDEYNVQPVDVSGTLYYVYKDYTGFIIFYTLCHIFEYIKGNIVPEMTQCFDSEEDVRKYLENL